MLSESFCFCLSYENGCLLHGQDFRSDFSPRLARNSRYHCIGKDLSSTAFQKPYIY